MGSNFIVRFQKHIREKSLSSDYQWRVNRYLHKYWVEIQRHVCCNAGWKYRGVSVVTIYYQPFHDCVYI